MRALTVRPGTANSAAGRGASRSPTDRAAQSSLKAWQSVYAGPTWRSWPATTAGRRRAKTGSSSGTSRSAGCSRRRRTAGFRPGDLVAGIVRRPDPVPCPNCAVGEWDMCRNGQYTEHGIKEIDGFCSERWRIEPELRGQGRPGARASRRPDGAGQRAGQGLGARRADRPARAVAAARVLVTGRRADRPAGRADGPAARAGSPRPRPRRPTGRSRNW